MNTKRKEIIKNIWAQLKPHHVEVAATRTVYFYTANGCIRLSDHEQVKYRASRPIVLNLKWTDAGETVCAKIQELKQKG